MQLSKWREKQGLSVAQLATEIGVSRQTLWRYESGQRFPEIEIIDRIFEATGGKVTANDFHNNWRGAS